MRQADAFYCIPAAVWSLNNQFAIIRRVKGAARWEIITAWACQLYLSVFITRSHPSFLSHYFLSRSHQLMLGVQRQETIWTEVRGQSLLGEDTFMDKLADRLKKHKDIPEIPRSQRYATRPALAVLLPDEIVQDQKKLKRKLAQAVEQHGYRQSELARHIEVHYSTVSRWLREYENARRKT